MTPTPRHFKLIAAALLLCLSAQRCHADIVVIVSLKNPTNSLSSEQVANIFLGRESTFPLGGRVVPIDQEEGTAVRDAFYLKATGKSFPQIKSYWAKLIFTGKAQPPKEVGDSVAVRKMVAEHSNMIGYIDSNAVDASVRVVLTIP